MQRIRPIVLIVTVLSSGLAAFSQVIEKETYYDDEGAILKEIYTLQSSTSKILEGPYTAYYPNGKIKTSGQYTNNVSTGLWKFYYHNGKLRMQGGLNAGKNHGLWEYYYENGVKSMEGEVDGTKREGPWKMYYKSGALKSEGQFKKGKKHGAWKYYFETGGIQARAEYFDGEGDYQEYFNTGNLKMEGKKVNGQKEGRWSYYYEDGTTKGSGEFAEGLKSGQWKYYNEEGAIVSEGEYYKGQPDGLWIDYYENGSISSQGNYSEGQKNGSWKLYYDDGTDKGVGAFDNGTGDYAEYYKNGNIKVRGRYLNGKNHGLWEYYYESGAREGKCEFDSGEGEYIGYSPNGQIKMKGHLRGFERVGIWELYKDDGTLAGYYRPYYEDGNNILWLAKDSERQQALSQYRVRRVGSYKYKKKKFSYFDPQINEFRAIIIGYNPFAPVLNGFPVGLEHYNQNRLGHEILFNLVRSPFFRNHKSLDPGAQFDQGWQLALRQKLYNNERRTGTPYFGHEIRYSDIRHKAEADDPGDPGNLVLLTQKETKYEYSLLVGNRFFKAQDDGGVTIDMYLGFGIGYRSNTLDFSPTIETNQFFEHLPISNVSYALRAGINLGFAIPTRR